MVLKTDLKISLILDIKLRLICGITVDMVTYYTQTIGHDLHKNTDLENVN